MAPDLDCISPAHLMEGYLRKSKKWSKRYFVLREGPPPCLEYYDSAKRKTGKPKKVIQLKDAWNIDKKVTSKQKHLIGIYTETEYFAMGAENDLEQENWVHALQKAILGSKGQANRSHLMYRHIWQGNVDTKDLENCNSTTRINLQGPHRCCLTDKTMVFVRVTGAGSCNLQAHNHVEITIASIRSCGHKDNLFFMEPGRSSGIGTGKLWMDLEDNAIAYNMHKTILALWKLGQDDSRQRSYSFGPSAVRPSSNRSRYYYNPPPSQVGLGKPSNINHAAIPKPAAASDVSRNRCESFPAAQAVTLTDESRYRTSSEGENTLKRHYPLHSLSFRRKPGSISPIARNRVYSQGKRPLHLQASVFHFRTSSLPGSYTSSSNSSIEQINTALDYPQNGPSPATSENQGSSDEASFFPFIATLSQTQVQRSFVLHGAGYEMAPPPPSIPPETTPVLTTGSTPTPAVQDSDYVHMKLSHSRSRSMDDNLSSAAASPLSASPQAPLYFPGVSPSPDASCGHGQSPSQSSSHSHSGDMGRLYTPTSGSPDDYAFMSPGSSEAYPHESSACSEQLSPDYTCMAPGRGAAAVAPIPTEDKSGYVPMRPLVRSQPQDIVSSRRRSLSDNRLVSGSYSPASPLSRSPDKPRHFGVRNHQKCAKCKRDLPHSCPSHCGTLNGPLCIPPVSCHGLKVDAKNDFSFDRLNQSQKSSRHNSTDKPPMNYSEDYASMDAVARSAGVQSRARLNDACGGKEARDGKDVPSPDQENDHEYLPMSPMNVSNFKKSVVGNVLSIAESVSKASAPLSAGEAVTPMYPHQQNIKNLSQYSTNSLDRSTKQPRKRTTSLGIALLPGQRNATRASKHGRKYSFRGGSDSSKSTPLATESSSGASASSSSRGGEYVSIDFDKARKQLGPGYVSLAEPVRDSPSQLPNTPKLAHDSNRNNILSGKHSPPRGDYALLKPGTGRGSP